jgi:hypothetical protein
MALADCSGSAVEFVGLKSLDCWDRGFESRCEHGSSFLVLVMCCVGSGLCDRLITRSGESYCVCVFVCVCVCVSNCVCFRNLKMR